MVPESQPLSEGYHLITISTSDAAGNTTTTGLGVTIDTTPPAKPTIALDPASDSGIKGDNETSVTAPTFNGTTEPGATVVLTDGGAYLGSAIADASGHWTISVCTPLSNGSHLLIVTASDLAGNTSSSTLTVTIDTIAPLPPTLGVSGDPEPDPPVPPPWFPPYVVPGISPVDNPMLSGTAEDGASIRIFEGSDLIGSGTATGGTFKIQVEPLVNGLHALMADASDAAGNTSTRATALELMIDPTPPTISFAGTAPTASGVQATGTAMDAESGLSAVNVSVEAAGTSTPLFSGTALLTATGGGGATWSFNFPTALPPGDYTVLSTATNGGGLITPTPAHDYKVNANGSTTESWTQTDLTTGKPVQVSITYNPNGSKSVTTITSETNGWGVTTTNTNTIDLDPQGNYAGSSESSVVLLPSGSYVSDTTYTGPDGLVVDEVHVTSHVNADGSHTDTTEDDPHNGTSSITVTVTDKDSNLVSQSVNNKHADGTRTETDTTFNPDGSSTTRKIEKDKDGKALRTTIFKDLRVGQILPPLNFMGNWASEDDGTPPPPPPPPFNNPTPLIFGKATPNAGVTILEDSGPVATIAVDSSGNWSFTSMPLADGTHQIGALVQDGLGDSTEVDMPITIDTGPPSTSIVSGPPSTTSQTTASFTFGSTKPGTLFEYSLDGSGCNVTHASLTLTGLSTGPHFLQVYAIDLAGNEDPSGASYTWMVGSMPSLLLTSTIVSSGGQLLGIRGSTSDVGSTITQVTVTIYRRSDNSVMFAGPVTSTGPGLSTWSFNYPVLAYMGDEYLVVTAVDALGTSIQSSSFSLFQGLGIAPGL
jgi:hypothetical protein